MQSRHNLTQEMEILIGRKYSIVEEFRKKLLLLLFLLLRNFIRNSSTKDDNVLTLLRFQFWTFFPIYLYHPH